MLPHLRRHHLALLVLVLLSAGCGPEAESTEIAVSAEPVAGGVLHYAQIAPSSLDPAIVIDSFNAAVVNMVHAGLLRHDENFGIRPDVARSWKIGDDGLVYRFVLRDDVEFHDGRPVEAADVVHSLQRVFDLDPESSELGRQYLGVIEGTEVYARGEAESVSGLRVLGTHELEIRLARPYAAFLNVMASEFARIVPRPATDATSTDVSIGCGPFALEAWEPGDRLSLRRHDAYHDGTVALDGVVIHTPDTHTSTFARKAFAAGELDLIELTTAGTEDVDGLPDVTLHHRLELSLTFLAFTTDRPPFDDVRVRRAVAHAIELGPSDGIDPVRKPIATGVLPPGFPGHQPVDKRLKHDLEIARSLVESAGPLERPIRVGVARRGPAFERAALAVCDQIGALGYEVEPQILDWAAFSEGLRSGAFDAFFLTWVADLPDADSFFYPLFHSEGSVNYLRYADTRVDAWLQTARGEVDQSRRLELYRRTERHVLQNAVIVPLHFNSTQIAVRNAVKNFEITSMGGAQLRLESVWMDPGAEGAAR